MPLFKREDEGKMQGTLERCLRYILKLKKQLEVIFIVVSHFSKKHVYIEIKDCKITHNFNSRCASDVGLWMIYIFICSFYVFHTVCITFGKRKGRSY